ncbi:MAG: PspC domain-containing protein [Burkholderiaceae bacterium]|nr:PspC domain-containing protein [Burkholderiaceae bacterium]
MSLSDELLKLDQLRERGVLTPAEFEQAKRRLLEAGEPPPAVQAVNRLRRSSRDRWLAGVCGGLARVTGAEAWVWRLLFALLFFFAGTGVLVYLLMWIFVPEEGAADPDSLTRSTP